jgi:hypothetical protein
MKADGGSAISCRLVDRSVCRNKLSLARDLELSDGNPVTGTRGANCRNNYLARLRIERAVLCQC